MIYSNIIIVGGGPAGSSCAYELRKAGIDCLILEKKKFPRTKLCAGWITPKVKDTLNLSDYPYGILHFKKMIVNIFGKKTEMNVSQYSIRRYEFDNYLLKRSKAKVIIHNVKNIRKEKEFYVIDDKYRCKYLVGAAGTFCPIYRTFFNKISPRENILRITAMEEEFRYNYKNSDCHLWFFKNSLPGYAWYVPKVNGYLNIGIGGQFEKIKNKNNNIINQWNYFISELKKQGLVKNHNFKPVGYVYYLRQNAEKCQIENAYIIGDSAGLATIDLGEGIGPAVESGIICAKSIISGKKMSLEKIQKNSFDKKSISFFYNIMKKFYT